MTVKKKRGGRAREGAGGQHAGAIGGRVGRELRAKALLSSPSAEAYIRALEEAERTCKAANESLRKTIAALKAELAERKAHYEAVFESEKEILDAADVRAEKAENPANARIAFRLTMWSFADFVQELIKAEAEVKRLKAKLARVVGFVPTTLDEGPDERTEDD